MAENPQNLENERFGDDILSATEQQQATSVRHFLMLKTMSYAQESFTNAMQTTKLSNGLRMQSSRGELEGWPLLRLELCNNSKEDLNALPYLEVRTTDSNSEGLVELALSTGQILGRVNLRVEKDFLQIAPFIKKAIQDFTALCEKSCEEIAPIPTDKTAHKEEGIINSDKELKPLGQI